MEGIWEGVANYGFPMIISIYLLMRVEKKLEELSGSITELCKAIQILREVRQNG